MTSVPHTPPGDLQTADLKYCRILTAFGQVAYRTAVMLSIRNISFSSVFRSHVKVLTENYQSGACTVRRGNFSKREFSCDAGHLEISGVKLYWERMGHGPHVVLGLPGLAGMVKLGRISESFSKFL